MNSVVLLFALLIPVVGGAVLFGAKNWSYRKLQIYSETLVILTSLLVLLMILKRPTAEFHCFYLTGNLRITLKLDRLGGIFAGLVAFLWPFANLYAFEYMAHDKERRMYFFFLCHEPYTQTCMRLSIWLMTKKEEIHSSDFIR